MVLGHYLGSGVWRFSILIAFLWPVGPVLHHRAWKMISTSQNTEYHVIGSSLFNAGGGAYPVLKLNTSFYLICCDGGGQWCISEKTRGLHPPPKWFLLLFRALRKYVYSSMSISVAHKNYSENS